MKTHPNRRAGAAARRRQVALLLMAALACCAHPASASACPDLIVGPSDLEEILDQTLGNLRGLVDHRAVAIDPAGNSCTVRISLSTSALSQYGGNCALEACSTVLFRQKSLALQQFDVGGCDALFTVFGLSRHVASTYVDASTRIREHCGAGDFDISRVAAVRIAGEPRLRIGFRAAPAAP